MAVVIALAGSSAAFAQSADYYRGGWRTGDGEPHVYQFVIRGETVTGFHCTQCADGTTLAPLEGTFDEHDGLDFTLRHLTPEGAPASEQRLRARLVDGTLVIVGEGDRLEHIAIKDPRGPTPSPFPINILPPNAPPVPLLALPARAAVPPPAPYVQPAAWRKLTADDVAGVWIGFGVGMDKQYFVIRKDGGRLFGLASGRCDNPYTFGALENFTLHGDTLEFDIVHQDWGDGPTLPFSRHVTAHIAMNEMRMDARRPDQSGPGIVASLIGPISIAATAGNVVGE
jgi:hypothetical protein